MNEGIRIVYEGGTGELIEKKSKFIATVSPAETEEEALAFVERLKKQYWDATHNCFAYVIGDRQQIQRYSDDGEPSGTAGRPMLDVLLGARLHNVAAVVTRYFGGTLLGTGGLVRAYSRSTQAGLADSIIVEKCQGVLMSIETDYNGIGKLQYISASMELHTIHTEYTDKVISEILVPLEQVHAFEKKVTEATSGKADIEVAKEVYYGFKNEEIIVF